MNENEILERACGIGLADPKYRFVFAPQGFLISQEDLEELVCLGATTMNFLAKADSWYRREMMSSGGSHLVSILQRGIPRDYLPFGLQTALPQVTMIDTVWTENGWRVAEIDGTNRNGLGWPLVIRHLYELPSLWKGNDEVWRDAGFGDTVQVMAHHCRFYEPYYRFFLKAVGGTLIPETEIVERIDELEAAASLLDLPILFKGECIKRLVELTNRIPVGIPPKHYLSSKALLALPWETKDFLADDIARFLPKTHLLRCHAQPPEHQFFVKLLQSSGAHGTFYNDMDKFKELATRRPQAIVQNAWPIAKRPIVFLNGDTLKEEYKFIRLSIYVSPSGEIADADVTASDEVIVHGNNRSIITVPVMSNA